MIIVFFKQGKEYLDRICNQPLSNFDLESLLWSAADEDRISHMISHCMIKLKKLSSQVLTINVIGLTPITSNKTF